MKTALTWAGCITLGLPCFGQESVPVQWVLTASAESGSPVAPGSEVSAQLDARIEPGWHIYSLHEEPGGPTAMKIGVPAGSPFAISGDVDAPRPESAADPGFGIVTRFYTSKVRLSVPLRSTRKAAGTVTVDVEYQACNRETCLRPAVEHLTAPVTKTERQR